MLRHPGAVVLDGDIRDASPSLDWKVWAGGSLLAFLLVALYLRIGIKLVADWINFPDYSHGLLIPFFAGFLLLDQRNLLLSTTCKASWSVIAEFSARLFVLLV